MDDPTAGTMLSTVDSHLTSQTRPRLIFRRHRSPDTPTGALAVDRIGKSLRTSRLLALPDSRRLSGRPRFSKEGAKENLLLLLLWIVLISCTPYSGRPET